MWYDSDIDAIMAARRTTDPGWPHAPRTCAGLRHGPVGFSWLAGAGDQLVAAGLLAFTIFFYVVIYTMWLKRSTPQNIVIGGAAGAFPPVVGWAAVTGTVSFESLVLFLIIFLWTAAPLLGAGAL